VAGRWFSQGTPVSSTDKTTCHGITEILLNVTLNTITLLLLVVGEITLVKMYNLRKGQMVFN
jgi:hypothetical protein